MIIVNRDVFITQNMPRKNRPTQIEKFYDCRCGRCGSPYWLREADIRRAQKRNSDCKNCRLEHLADTLRANLNKPEQRVFNWLQEMEIPFSCQTVVFVGGKGFILDFRVGDCAIQVDGVYWHDQEVVRRRDELLNRLWLGHILRRDADEIMNQPGAALDKLEAAIVLAARTYAQDKRS